MKKLVFVLLIFVLTGLFLFPGDITPGNLNERGVLICEIGDEDVLCIINTRDESGTYWFIIKKFADNHFLGTNLSQLNEVDQLSMSPDGKYLGVRSVGEGHPMVEVVDLQKLRSENKYETLHVIDPYPGIVGMEKWEGGRLILSSDVPLILRKEDGRVDPNLLLSEVETFSLDAASGSIGSIDFDAKQWIQNALSVEKNPEVIKSLKEAARQLEKLQKK